MDEFVAFQSTRPRRARPTSPTHTAPDGRFQSTRPRRARLLAVTATLTLGAFQSTRPRRARQDTLGTTYWWPLFQSTRPRRARLTESLEYSQNIHVSIHAPAKGATGRFCRVGAPTSRFNPRAREGRDLKISLRKSNTTSFNPRAREGRDSTAAVAIARWWPFQSTRPRRARLAADLLPPTALGVSIHAPAKGATVEARDALGCPGVSIHAPAKGATARAVPRPSA